MTDDKDKHLGYEKPSMAQRVKDATADAMEAATYMQTMGIRPGHLVGESENKKDEAPSVVSAAMGKMESMVSEANKLAREKETDIIQARKEADEARANLYATQLATIEKLQTGLTDAIKGMEEKNSPEAAAASVERWQKILGSMKGEAPPQAPSQPERGMDGQTAIKLEEMRQNHELQMKQMDIQLAQINNGFQLEMLQFREDSNRRWREYEDGNKMKGEALGSLQDLPASIGSGVEKERGVSSNPGEETMEASVSNFKCSLCKTPITVEKGASMAVCPNEECGAQYEIKSK